MARINLLPWRAERRERRKRELFTQLGVAAAAAIVVVLLWAFWMNMRIANQNSRNAYLKAQIRQVDAKIAQIRNLEKVKTQLLQRKKIVEKLQASRSQMVHLFDQIVKTIPAGARLTSMTQRGSNLTLSGVAQSNGTVAKYMRSIEASPWMGKPRLVRTEDAHPHTKTPYTFELVVPLETPKPDKAQQKSAAAGGATTASAAHATAAHVAAKSASSGGGQS